MLCRIAPLALLFLLFALPAQSTVIYRVNVGGPQLAATDASSPDWSEDTSANPSIHLLDAGSNGLFSTASAIDLSDPSLSGSVAPIALFQTERWDSPGGTDIQWAFAIGAGQENVEVRLYFAEIYTAGINAPGQRIFDVAVEGAVPAVFDDIDPFSIAGGTLRGFRLSTLVNVNDGTLNLNLLHGAIENPNLKGIEIVVVPEPSTALLVGLGLTSLALKRRRGL